MPCAYTYLQRNPQDQEMSRLMEEYRSRYDLSGYLTDHEEGPHEVSDFCKQFKKKKKVHFNQMKDCGQANQQLLF